METRHHPSHPPPAPDTTSPATHQPSTQHQHPAVVHTLKQHPAPTITAAYPLLYDAGRAAAADRIQTRIALRVGWGAVRVGER